MGYEYPAADLVVMDFLQDVLPEETWVGSWWPDGDHEGPVVLVGRAGGREIDGTMYQSVEITVDAKRRADSRRLAFDIADSLRELAGRESRGILVDDVVEEQSPVPQRDVDDQARQEGMVYTFAFRKHYFPNEEE